MKSISVRPVDVNKKWVIVDATGKTVGRLAAKVASILRGKTKVSFTPHLDTGDNVIVINASKVVLTGNKMRDKRYYRHSSFIGGIKSVDARTLLETHPERILKSAIRGMIPANKLGSRVMCNLKIYAGSEHPHAAQNPETITL